MTETEEIKQKLDIVDVVGQYVQLKKSGKNYKGLCPFHGEKSPSFMVNQELQIYKCFGCNESGDIFNFVEKIEGYDFRQAIEVLAERAGVTLKQVSRSENPEGNKSILFEINEVTKKFYHYLLTKHAIGKPALEYLTDKRKLTIKTINDWELGYAPESWTSLHDFMIKKGYQEKDLLRAGVVVPDKFERHNNDKFRGRVTFPLTGTDGKVLGFGARTLTGREPKYLNTQETSIFHKENFLFGLNKTRMDIKNLGAVIVEGYMDAISAWQSGITNVTATCGTALTMPHLKILSRYSKDLTFCFDSDNAGVNATLRAIEMCAILDLNPKVAVLPADCKDIDDLSKKGPEKVKEMIASAIPAYDFVIQVFQSKNDLNSPIGKKKMMEEVAYYLSKSPNFVTREHYAQILGEKLNVHADSVIKYLGNKNEDELDKTLGPAISINNAKSPQDYLLALVLSQNTLDKSKEILQNLEPEDLGDNLPSRIYEQALNYCSSKRDQSVRAFINSLAGQELAWARELSLWDIGDFSRNEDSYIKELQETVNRILKDSRRKKMSALTYQIKEAERLGDTNKVAKLMSDFKNLSAGLHNGQKS